MRKTNPFNVEHSVMERTEAIYEAQLSIISTNIKKLKGGQSDEIFAMRIGVSSNTIANWLSGTSAPSLWNISLIQTQLGINILMPLL